MALRSLISRGGGARCVNRSLYSTSPSPQANSGTGFRAISLDDAHLNQRGTHGYTTKCGSMAGLRHDPLHMHQDQVRRTFGGALCHGSARLRNVEGFNKASREDFGSVCIAGGPSILEEFLHSKLHIAPPAGRAILQRLPSPSLLGIDHTLTGMLKFGTLQERSICAITKGSIKQCTLMNISTAVPMQPIIPWKLSFQKKSISIDSFSKNLKLPTADALKQPLDSIKQSASRYREAAGIQVEAFWKRNVMILVGAVGVLSCFLLWRVMYGVANIFVSFSEGMAKFGFLAMAAATVAFTGMILKARFTISPDKVYRIAMRTLNTSAAALEVLGAPLTGSDLRAYVMSGGGLKLKNLRPRFASKRCFLLFPIQGSERRGLVSAEVKKKKGKYDFRLLAIDVATQGADQRVFLIGDELEYRVGGGLMSKLRDPILKAIAAEKEFDAQDEREEEEDKKAEEARREQELIEEEARREKELKEEEARRNEEIERLEKVA